MSHQLLLSLCTCGNILENNSRQIYGTYKACRLLKSTLHFSKLKYCLTREVCPQGMSMDSGSWLSQLYDFNWDGHGVGVRYQDSSQNFDV